jgi:hypothetical protein
MDIFVRKSSLIKVVLEKVGNCMDVGNLYGLALFSPKLHKFKICVSFRIIMANQ